MAGWSYEEFVERFADATEPMATVTDEELFVLTAGAASEDRLVPLATMDALSETERRLAARTARRSLVARGVVAPVDPAEVDTATGLVELHVEGPMVPILQLLGDPWPFVLLQRQHLGDSTQVFLTIADRLVLLHDVRGGLHRFWLFTPEVACRQLAAALDPVGAASTDGPDDVEVLRAAVDEPPAAWSALRERIESAQARAQLYARRREDLEPQELLFEIASLDDGVVLVSGTSPSATGDATEVVVRRLSATALAGVAVHALGLVEVVA